LGDIAALFCVPLLGLKLTATKNIGKYQVKTKDNFQRVHYQLKKAVSYGSSENYPDIIDTMIFISLH